MAKHAKRRKKPTTRRRRRVSGVGNIDAMGVGLGIAGAFVAIKLKTMLSKDPTKTTMVNLAPYAGLAAGIALPFLVKNNPTVKALALGMSVGGGIEAIKKLAPNVIGRADMVSPIIAATSNAYRRPLKPSVNGITLPKSSVYANSMSVVNGVSNNEVAARMMSGSSVSPGSGNAY